MRFSDFEVLGELGQGAYARVLRVRQRSDDALFALKVQNKAFLIRERKAAAARLERDLLDSLRGCPGVLQLCFTFQDASCLYLGTELCACDLFCQLRRRPHGRAELWEARWWTAQLLVALEAVHAAGAVHRDVKPENVLLTKAGHVRLADFGSALRLSEPVGPSLAGTAEYSAPELVDGCDVTPAADFWSLGCLLFHVLVGQPPFRGATEYLVFQAVLHQPLVVLDEVPADARSAIEALLVRNVEARCDARALRAHPFLRSVSWDTLWHDAAPEVLPPPPDTEQDVDVLNLEPPSLQLAPPVLPPVPPWELHATETRIFSAAAVRKRGARSTAVQLVVTSLGRVALLDAAGCPAVRVDNTTTADVRLVDSRHLALQADDGSDVFLELDEQKIDGVAQLLRLKTG